MPQGTASRRFHLEGSSGYPASGREGSAPGPGAPTPPDPRRTWGSRARLPPPTSRSAARAPSALPAPALGSPQAGREELTGLPGPGVAEAGPSKAPTRDGTIAREKQRRACGPRSEAPSPALRSQGAQTHRGLQRGARPPGQEEDALHAWVAPSPACGGPGGLARSLPPRLRSPGPAPGSRGRSALGIPRHWAAAAASPPLVCSPLGPRWLGRDGVLFGAKGLGASRESGGWRNLVLRPWNARPQARSRGVESDRVAGKGLKRFGSERREARATSECGRGAGGAAGGQSVQNQRRVSGAFGPRVRPRSAQVEPRAGAFAGAELGRRTAVPAQGMRPGQPRRCLLPGPRRP